MKRKVAVVAILIFFSFAATSYGMERFEIVTTQQLQQMLKERSENRLDFALVNTLDTLIYEHHSIPGSINIPWSRVSKHVDRLGEDRDRLIVTYCMGYR